MPIHEVKGKLELPSNCTVIGTKPGKDPVVKEFRGKEESHKIEINEIPGQIPTTPDNKADVALNNLLKKRKNG